MKVKLKTNKYNIIFIVQCLLFFVLSLFLVPEYDDLIFKYNFAYEDFSSFWHYVLYYGNGRLLGNAAALFFSRYMELFRIFETGIVVLFALLAERLSELENSKIFVFAAITVIPLWQFIQLFSWMSSFVNYFIPIVLFLLTLYMIKMDLCAKCKFCFAALFMLGICEQLFVEHNTVINTVFAVCLLFYFVKTKSSHIKEAAVLLASNAVGAAVIFGYKFYVDYSDTHIFKTLSHYRQNILYAAEQGGIRACMVFAMQNIKYFVLTLFLCILLIGALLSVMLYIEAHADKRKIKHKFVFAAAVISYLLLFVIIVCNFTVYNNDIPNDTVLFAALLLFAAVTAVLIIVLFIKVILKRMKKMQRIRIYFLLAFAFFAFVPFLLVGPYSYRSAFLSVFFIMLAVLEVIKFAKENYGFGIECLYNTVFAVTLIVLIFYTGFYIREKKIFDYREEYCKSSYYLPAFDGNINFTSTDAFWIKYSGAEHEFISLDEFEKIIA